MQNAVVGATMCLLAILLSPALALAKGEGATASSSVLDAVPFGDDLRSFADRVNAWFKSEVGIEYFDLLRIAARFTVASGRIILDVGGRALDWLDDWSDS